jgi:hypothetical protein
MNTINLVPVNETATPVRIDSRSYSMIILCLAACGIEFECCDCGECKTSDIATFEAEDVPEICAALSDICSRMIDAGLKDLALDAAFLLSALPSSGGMRAEKIDN